MYGVFGLSLVTDTELKMLALVTNEPQRCNALGVQLWKGTRQGFGGSAPYARPAGKVLLGLKRLGLVENVVLSRHVFGYRLTSTGRAVKGTLKGSL